MNLISDHRDWQLNITLSLSVVVIHTSIYILIKARRAWNFQMGCNILQKNISKFNWSIELLNSAGAENYEMNFTEQYRARTLAFIMPPSEGPLSGWKGYALRVTVLAVGFGIYVLLFKKNNSSSGRWSLRRTRETPVEPDKNSNTEMKKLRYKLSLKKRETLSRCFYHFKLKIIFSQEI